VIDELGRLDATAHAELIRRGHVTPKEAVAAAIARIEALNPEINAVIHEFFDGALSYAEGAPHGPFHGVPFLAKDALCYRKGDPHHQGMRWLKELGWREDHDSYLATKLQDAGFVFLGRTNVPELLMSYTTEPVAYGPTRNPWDPTRSPGGSSGGSAAAVASGMVPVAHANDWGGSIRDPASECGLVGMKPSRGRTSLGPLFGDVMAGFTSELVVARSVRDVAGVLDVVSGAMPGDPFSAPAPQRAFLDEVASDPSRLRVGVFDQGLGFELHPDCRAAVAVAVGALEGLGHEVENSYPGALIEGALPRKALVVYYANGARVLDSWSERTGHKIGPDDVEPFTWFRFKELAAEFSLTEYLEAIDWLHGFTRRMASWWEDGFDILLTPTLGEPPPLLGWNPFVPDHPHDAMFRMTPHLAYLMPFNVTGQPAVSLPLYWSDDGLPIGVQLVAAYGREDVLLRAAAQLETSHPWADRRPQIFA
jgi:amidase